MSESEKPPAKKKAKTTRTSEHTNLIISPGRVHTGEKNEFERIGGGCDVVLSAAYQAVLSYMINLAVQDNLGNSRITTINSDHLKKIVKNQPSLAAIQNRKNPKKLSYNQNLQSNSELYKTYKTFRHKSKRNDSSDCENSPKGSRDGQKDHGSRKSDDESNSMSDEE